MPDPIIPPPPEKSADKKVYKFHARCQTPGCAHGWSYESGERRRTPAYERCGNCGQSGTDAQGKRVGIVVTEVDA
jgi:hypothetical protein